MATKFLRKIILEELQKVLKEADAAVATRGGVSKIGPETEVGGSVEQLTQSQRAEAQKLVDASNGRLTFKQAAQQVAAKAMGTGAIESGQGLSGLERIIAATTKPSRNQIFDLQRQLVKLGLLRSRQVDGIYGPNTQRATALYASSLDPSGKFAGKEVSKFSANDVSVIANDIKTMNRQQIAQARKDVVSGEIAQTYGKIAEPAVAAAAAASKSDTATPEPDMEKRNREMDLKLRTEPMYRTPPTRKTPFDESITREINKLLKML